ncbi:MAG: T9SS type A sorting domain-containing protein [Flavisolibacter sp.]
MKNLYQLLIFLLMGLSFDASAQVPLYNSYPSASATIYLDFDGQYVTGTGWNYNGPLTLAPAGVTNDQITKIFNRVSEDFRPFNINVTTDSTKYWAAPATQRIRIILTVTSDWYGSTAGGVSYMGAFTWGDNTPSFVFTKLLNFNTKNIAEATSHEAGHTLGLKHQSSYDNNCVKTAEYNPGMGSGEIAWAPIMGVGYYKNLTTWHNGPNPYGCTADQDDLAIITSTTNGFGYRTSAKTATSFSSAAAIPVNNNQFQANGVIVTSADNDYYKISIPTTGPVKIQINPYSVAVGDSGSNLDVEASLYTSKQKLINTYNPPDLLNATIDTSLAAGNYYLVVKGSSNAFASSYASLGAYSIQGASGSFIILPLHKLELKGKDEAGRHQLDWMIDADETVVRQALEVSTDATHFNILTQPGGEQRSYSYVPVNTGSQYYRLHVFLDDGKQYYSNIVSLPASGRSHPLLIGNVISQTVSVNSNALYDYHITDFSGRLMSKGKLVQGYNAIPAAALNSGLYLIRFSNGTEQYTEKFMKQ